MQDRLLNYGPWSYEYLADGRLTKRWERITATQYNLTCYDYDLFGALRRVDIGNPSGSTVEDPCTDMTMQSSIHYDIDPVGRRIGRREVVVTGSPVVALVAMASLFACNSWHRSADRVLEPLGPGSYMSVAEGSCTQLEVSRFDGERVILIEADAESESLPALRAEAERGSCVPAQVLGTADPECFTTREVDEDGLEVCSGFAIRGDEMAVVFRHWDYGCDGNVDTTFVHHFVFGELSFTAHHYAPPMDHRVWIVVEPCAL
jgi:hypothetical protein